MSKLSYPEQAEYLGKTIDIAIESIKKFPPNEFKNEHLTHFINTYLEFKHRVMNPDPRYRNPKSLSYLQNDILTYFQEGTGEAINYFWKQIKDQDLKYRRENKLTKVLKRQKIKNQIEYNFILDVLVPYQQEGLINKDEAAKLSQMILDFEKKLKS